MMKNVFLGSVLLASLVAQGAVVILDDSDQTRFFSEENANAHGLFWHFLVQPRF